MEADTLTDNLRLGIDIGATNTKAGIVDDKGEILAYGEWGSATDSGPEPCIAHLIDSIEALLENNGELAPKVDSLGVAIAGWIDPKRGFIYNSPNMKDFRDVPLGDALKNHFPYNVHVDNDTTVATWGEYLFGIDPKPDSLLGVFLGTGVGGGLVLNGKPWRGPFGSAGEIGHTVIEPDGPECKCGSKGCLEVYIGAEGITQTYEGLLCQSGGCVPPGIELTPQFVYEVGKSGDPSALATYAKVGRYLGIALANVVDLLSIDACVIGGKVSRASDLFWRPMINTFKKSILDPPNGQCVIHHSRLVDRSGILGAAFLPESFA
jgi:glucokinase